MKEFIPDIHHYCDQWCDKCRLKGQCMFWKEGKNTEQPKNMQTAEYWVNLENKMDQSVSVIKRWMQNQGIDLQAIEAESTEESDFTFQLSGDILEIRRLAGNYALLSKNWLDISMEEKDQNDQVREAKKTIAQFAFFIDAKANRALKGLKSLDAIAEDVQHDANGSAKVAIEAIKQSIKAWEFLYDTFPNQSTHLEEPLMELAKLKELLQSTFPNAAQFKRPGFD